MKIKFSQPVALSDGRVFAADDVADLDPAVAAPSLAAGHATALEAPRKGKASASTPVETATL